MKRQTNKDRHDREVLQNQESEGSILDNPKKYQYHVKELTKALVHHAVTSTKMNGITSDDPEAVKSAFMKFFSGFVAVAGAAVVGRATRKSEILIPGQEPQLWDIHSKEFADKTRESVKDLVDKAKEESEIDFNLISLGVEYGLALLESGALPEVMIDAESLAKQLVLHAKE